MVSKAPIEIGVTDRGTGLKSITATLSAAGKEHSVSSRVFATPMGRGSSVELAKLAGIKEGRAVLRVVARDGSLFTGNETVLQKEITIDITPPTLQLIAEDRYINFGGAGAIVYKPSADTATSGVRVGDHFFPGHKDQVKGQQDHYVALFAHPYNVPPNAKAFLVATDKAAIPARWGFPYELKNVKYRRAPSPSPTASSSKVRASQPQRRQGGQREGDVPRSQQPPEEAERRQDRGDHEEVHLRKTVERRLCPALELKVEANFADERTYTYKGEAIDKAYHLGYDLSVTKGYPAEAANAGTVVFAGDLGIYGNTVILDHGLGLFTLYSHLSSIDVKEGDTVKQRQALGRTGQTGLAAGDHLHYGVYLHGVAVLPVEWWDPKWIKDNIEPKLEGMSGEAIAEMQQPRKSARKRRR